MVTCFGPFLNNLKPDKMRVHQRNYNSRLKFFEYFNDNWRFSVNYFDKLLKFIEINGLLFMYILNTFISFDLFVPVYYIFYYSVTKFSKHSNLI